jgi:membrane fusion protein (multidrug efflux system)
MAETATPTATPNNSAAPSAAVTSTPAQHSAAPNAAAPNAAALNAPAHETQTKPTGDAAQHNATQPKKKKEGGIRRIIMPVLFFGVLIFAANYGYHKYVFGQNHEETDDAQVDGNIDPVLPRIAGYVTAVYVNDNQRVKDGEMLVKLDTADLLLKVSAAQAAYQNAEAAVKVAQANVFTSQVNVRKTHLDLERDTRLLAAAAITQQQYDLTKASAEAADAMLAATTDQITVAQSVVGQKHVEIEQAQLQLSYTTIRAPWGGLISRKSVQVGQFVQVGQPLMAVTENDSIWVTANFKETQVSDIKPGQPVDVQIDAYPDVVFHGRVQSFAAATGARFSLLPPDNATGNFVKVVQRVPVKILLESKPNPNAPLRPGMSVNAVVTTK